MRGPFGLSMVKQLQAIHPRAAHPSGRGETRAWDGQRGRADDQRREPPAVELLQGSPASSPAKQATSFTPTWKAAKGRLDADARPFSGLAWSSRYSQ